MSPFWISLATSLGLLMAGLRWTRKLNSYFVSRYYLSPLLVLFFYLVVFSVFTILPWLLFQFTNALMGSSPSEHLWTLGASEALLGAYLSYRDFLKQA